MTLRKAMAATGLVWLGTVAFSLALWTRLPERVPTHWNIHGQADGFTSRNGAMLFLPLIMLAFWALMVVLPMLSPMRFKIDAFRPSYNYVMVVLMAMFAYIQVVSLLSAMNPSLDSGKLVIGGMLLFMGLIGNLMGKIKRNFWMGIRTPWTLASEEVWNTTHRLAGRLIVATCFIGFLIVVLSGPIWLAMTLMLVGFLYPALFSLVEYKKLERIGRG